MAQTTTQADAILQNYYLPVVREMVNQRAVLLFGYTPAELEAVLGTHPAVGDCAVVPSPESDSGEVPKAFVVLKPSLHADAEELMAYVAGRVAPYKRIRAVELIDVIPRTASGKILRRVLKDRAISCG